MDTWDHTGPPYYGLGTCSFGLSKTAECQDPELSFLSPQQLPSFSGAKDIGHVCSDHYSSTPAFRCDDTVGCKSDHRSMLSRESHIPGCSL